jgi:hypothetical protein
MPAFIIGFILIIASAFLTGPGAVILGGVTDEAGRRFAAAATTRALFAAAAAAVLVVAPLAAYAL